MKIIKRSLFVLTLAIISAIIGGKEAQGIVFIPPVIYIVTLSLGAFVVNISIFIAMWLAAQGIINRLYFGKAMHEIIRIFFNILGHAAIIFIVSMASVLFYNPLNSREVLVSSILAGILCLALVFLSNFREYRLAQKKEKLAMIGSMSIFSVFTVIIIFISASSALKTKILRTDENDPGIYEEDRTASSPNGFALPMEKTSESISKDEAEKGIAPEYKNGAAQDLKLDQEIKQVLWFYPSDFGLCSVYFDANLIKSFHPENNCYYQDSGKAQRLPCPMSVSIEDIPVSLIKGDDQHNIYGQGSCAEKYYIRIRPEGFKMNE